jgi:hypothetical protein
MVSVVTFLLPLVWVKCTPSPTDLELHELPLLEELVLSNVRVEKNITSWHPITSPTLVSPFVNFSICTSAPF